MWKLPAKPSVQRLRRVRPPLLHKHPLPMEKRVMRLASASISSSITTGIRITSTNTGTSVMVNRRKAAPKVKDSNARASSASASGTNAIVSVTASAMDNIVMGSKASRAALRAISRVRKTALHRPRRPPSVLWDHRSRARASWK